MTNTKDTRFQSFAAATTPEQGPPRLEALRQRLTARGLSGFLVPRADAHQGEYVAPCDDRLAWLTGFTGSAGIAVALTDKAGIFVDGRYRVQVRKQVDAVFTRLPWPETSVAGWLIEAMPQGGRVGFDPWLHTEAEIRRLEAALAQTQITLVPTENLIDAIWQDRPARPDARAVAHPEALAGRSAMDKRRDLAAALTAKGPRAAVLTLPDSINWLLNIRGRDLTHLPVAQAFAILGDDGSVSVFSDIGKFDDIDLGDGVTAHDWSAFADALGQLDGPVLADPDSAPQAVFAALRAAGIECVTAPDPCLLPKACKTPAEIDGARAAHLRDGVALTRFLHWFDVEAPKGRLTEIDAVRALEAFRAQTGTLEDISFDTIAGAGPNGAIVHYRVSHETNAPILPGQLFLIDSGAQYRDGTTDVTRTLPVGPVGDEERLCFTLVLKGMIAIHRARFPKGVTGAHLDALARAPLWATGRDYDHGTGHGVGSFLSVHEGPVRIARTGTTALAPGMILSNEPGYYREGAFGIRIENLIHVTDASPGADPERAHLGFETLTLAPIDRRLIDPEALSRDERDWLNTYHADVAAHLVPLLESEGQSDTAIWLRAACAAI